MTTLEGLEVNPDRMLANLDIHGGLVASEAVIMALAEHVGRQTAHHIVHEAAMTAQGSDRSFLDCLAENERVTDHLDVGRLAALTDHRSYVGNAGRFVDETLERTGTADGSEPNDATGR